MWISSIRQEVPNVHARDARKSQSLSLSSYSVVVPRRHPFWPNSSTECQQLPSPVFTILDIIGPSTFLRSIISAKCTFETTTLAFYGLGTDPCYFAPSGTSQSMLGALNRHWHEHDVRAEFLMAGFLLACSRNVAPACRLLFCHSVPQKWYS